jgi:hypothetical protein
LNDSVKFDLLKSVIANVDLIHVLFGNNVYVFTTIVANGRRVNVITDLIYGMIDGVYLVDLAHFNSVNLKIPAFNCAEHLTEAAAGGDIQDCIVIFQFKVTQFND